MKKYILVSLCLTLIACTQNAQELVMELEKNRDVIQTLDAYKNIYTKCFFVNGQIHRSEYRHTSSYQPYRAPKICYDLVVNTMYDQDIDLGCVRGTWEAMAGDHYYYSDKCENFRKNLPESKKGDKIGYFDYKRFLPQNSQVKTQDEFLVLVEYYKNHDKEATIKLATMKTKCSDLYPGYNGYKSSLNNMFLIWVRDQKIYNQRTTECLKPIYDKLKQEKLLSELAKKVERYGKMHFCDTDGWLDDMRNAIIEQHDRGAPYFCE